MDQRPTRTLLVEDNPGDAFLIREQLSQAGTCFDVRSADHLAAAIECVAASQPDVVLLDLNLPDSRGTETIRRMIQKVPHVPVLVLTGQDDEALAVSAMQEGAQDYLLKSHLDRQQLARAIKYAIERQSLLLALHRRGEQQLHFKDQLLSHVSHELRSPLTCIDQFVTIVLDGLSGPITGDQRECLATVLKSSNQLRSMIDDLLETARIEAGKLKLELRCVGLQDLIYQAIEMLGATASAKGVTVHSHLQAAPLLAYGDPSRILQVLLNLIENAVKFTPRDGLITIQADTFSSDSNFVVVNVTDTGCGISEGALPLVFERLFQEGNATDGARKGLGLGLSICEDLVSRQGGKIWVTSELGRGSTFSFTLPTFSLSKLVFPVITENGALRKVNSLITIKVAPIPLTTAIDAWGKTRRMFREVLQRCILPDKDTLLPSIGQPEIGEVFFILAAADSLGADVLVKRIRDQVARCKEVTANSVLDVSNQLVETPEKNNERSLDIQVLTVATNIASMMNQAVEKGQSHNA